MPSFESMDRCLDIIKLRVRVRLPPPPPPPSSSSSSLAMSPCAPPIYEDCSSSNDLTTEEDRGATEEEQFYDGKFSDSCDGGDDEDEGCSTPRSSESQIPEVRNCPPAPKKRKAELRANGHELTKKKKKNTVMAQAMTRTRTRTRTKTMAMAMEMETKKTNTKKNHGRSLVFVPDFDPSSMFLLCA